MKLTHLIALLSCLCLGFGLVGCVEDLGGGSGDDACTSDDDCADGQRCFRQGDEQFCVTPCANDADCGNGETCQGGACLAGEPNNDPNNAPNNDPNNTPNNDPNNDPNNTPNNTPNNNPNNDPGDICAEACAKLSMCLDQVCTMPLVDPAACEADCRPDPVGFQADLIVTLSCEELNEAVLTNACQDPQIQAVCDCPEIEPNETNAGDACAADGDCQGGDLMAQCVPEVDEMTGDETGFVGGYCIAGICNGDAQCGEGNRCIGLGDGQGGTQNLCLGGCEGGNARGGCREGYGCWQVDPMDPAAAVCFPECGGDDECCPPEDPNCGAVCDAGTGSCVAGG